MRKSYNQRRRFLMHEFKKMGLECFEPFGAFYMFPCIMEFGMTSDEFATRFLMEEKVAVVPGNAFLTDENAPCLSFRLNYSTPTDEQIEKGVDILAEVASTMYR